jgi:hypothetical protein
MGKESVAHRSHKISFATYRVKRGLTEPFL